MYPNIVTPPAAGGPMPPGLGGAAAAAMQGQIWTPQQEQTPEAPYDDDAALLKLMEEARTECFEGKWAHEKVWWRNLLYFMSRQWIYYDRGRGTWQDKRMAKWIPKPITNKMRETVESILSVFQSVELGVNSRPEGNDPKNVRTAETLNELAPAVDAEHEMGRKISVEDFWLIITGNSFKHPWWNKRGESGTVLVPFEKCMACQQTSRPEAVVANKGMCPFCNTPTSMVQANDPQGHPFGETIRYGSGCTDVPSPFEIGIPESFTDFEDVPYLIRKRWRPKGWCERNLPADMIEKIQWERVSTDRSMQLLRAIENLTDQSTVTSGVASAEGRGEGVTEFEMWKKPDAVYPKGLLLRTIGEGGTAKVLRLPTESTPGPLPYKTMKGEPLFPWVHTAYTKVGGRIWGISPMDAIIQKQDQLNQIDSLIQLIIQRMANPVWLEPKGAEVKRFTGEPGLVVKYNPLLNSNAKPERIEGSNVPLSLLQIRQSYIDDIEALSGTYDVIKGAKPTGVEAFSALQLLVERSQSRYGPVLRARGESYRKWFSLAVEMERQFGPVQRVWSVLGPNNRWTFREFKNADLQGSVTILVEDGSQTPKTSLGKRAAIEQLRQLGVINPANPDTAYRVLQVFGQTDLWPGLDYDVKSALQEQDEWERWAQTVQFMPPENQFEFDPTTLQPMVDQRTGQPIPAMPMPDTPPPGQREVWHNDLVHAAEHRKWANSDNVRQILIMRPELKPYVAWMIEQHDMMLMMAAQAQQAAAGGGGMALGNSNNESGNPNDVPAGLQTQPNGPAGPNMGPQ